MGGAPERTGARLKANDVEFVRETMRLFPEASIEFLEQELLVEKNLC